MSGPKKNNRIKNNLMSHRKNTSFKRFNSFMNDVYDLLERDRYLDLKTEYIAIIISGQIALRIILMYPQETLGKYSKLFTKLDLLKKMKNITFMKIQANMQEQPKKNI